MIPTETSITLTTPIVTASLCDEIFLKDIRKQMLKFAILQLNDSNVAEDAVQEALMGAMKNADAFEGKAALKTWIFAILKNKITDILRANQRTINFSSLLKDEESEEDLLELFNQKGNWQPDERPVTWNHPEESLRQKQFWQVFEVCLDNLPNTQARMFMMREFMGFDAHEICQIVGVTTTNLHVTLYRARLRLRECLENRWFMKGESP